MCIRDRFSIKANLGTSPISSVPYVISEFTPLTVGIITILMHCVFITLQILILRKRYQPVQLMQLPVALVFGFMTDFAVWVLRDVHYSAYWQQWVLCAVGIPVSYTHLPACYTLYIDPALCNGCGHCLTAAPVGAVAGGEGMIHIIKKDLLEMKTPAFTGICPVGAIKKAGLVKPPVPAEPVPVGSFSAGAGAAGGGRRRRRG